MSYNYLDGLARLLQFLHQLDLPLVQFKIPLKMILTFKNISLEYMCIFIYIYIYNLFYIGNFLCR